MPHIGRRTPGALPTNDPCNPPGTSAILIELAQRCPETGDDVCRIVNLENQFLVQPFDFEYGAVAQECHAHHDAMIVTSCVIFKDGRRCVTVARESLRGSCLLTSSQSLLD